MVKLNCLIILYNILTACSSPNDNALQLKSSGKFEVGQIWHYNNREGEDNSTLTILKIEKYNKGDTTTVIHIRINDLKLKNPAAPGGYSNTIEHVSFSYDALLGSVTDLVGKTKSLPDFSEGYKQWRKAWDKDKAGIWDTEVKEAINCKS